MVQFNPKEFKNAEMTSLRKRKLDRLANVKESLSPVREKNFQEGLPVKNKGITSPEVKKEKTLEEIEREVRRQNNLMKNNQRLLKGNPEPSLFTKFMGALTSVFGKSLIHTSLIFVDNPTEQDNGDKSDNWEELDFKDPNYYRKTPPKDDDELLNSTANNDLNQSFGASGP